MGEVNFLKEAFLPPHPHPSRTLKRGDIFLPQFLRSTAIHQRSSALCIYKLTLRLKVFGATFFQKGSKKLLTQANYLKASISL